MSRVVHFEIHASDVARARKFYEDVFHWKIEPWEGPLEYWLITTGPEGTPGINGGLLKRKGDAPVDGQPLSSFACTIGGLESIDATIRRAVAGGGKLVVPKAPIPGVGWLAYLKDTEGNIFGVMEDDRDSGARGTRSTRALPQTDA